LAGQSSPGNGVRIRLELMLIGLCSDCIYCRRITSDRGAVFIQCQLSFTNPVFAKYPRLPVRSCSGYRSEKAESERDAEPFSENR
jgi:hypothetical protein